MIKNYLNINNLVFTIDLREFVNIEVLWMKKKLIIKKLIIFAFVIFFIGSYINQLVTTRRIENEIAVKRAQLEEVQEKNERLQEEVEKINSGSADYLERLARERLGMIKPGEKVVNSSNNEKESNPN